MNVLVNDALTAFYLWLCGVRHTVQHHSAREETRCRHSFRLAAMILLYALRERERERERERMCECVCARVYFSASMFKTSGLDVFSI